MVVGAAPALAPIQQLGMEYGLGWDGDDNDGNNGKSYDDPSKQKVPAEGRVGVKTGPALTKTNWQSVSEVSYQLHPATIQEHDDHFLADLSAHYKKIINLLSSDIDLSPIEAWLLEELNLVMLDYWESSLVKLNKVFLLQTSSTNLVRFLWVHFYCTLQLDPCQFPTVLQEVLIKEVKDGGKQKEPIVDYYTRLIGFDMITNFFATLTHYSVEYPANQLLKQLVRLVLDLGISQEIINMDHPYVLFYNRMCIVASPLQHLLLTKDETNWLSEFV